MCVATPDIPNIPERQAARGADGGDPTIRSNDRAKRRMAMAASILTPSGGLGAPTVTAPGTAATTLGG